MKIEIPSLEELKKEYPIDIKEPIEIDEDDEEMCDEFLEVEEFNIPTL